MIITICDDIMKTDFDLYNRVVEGFEAKIIKSDYDVEWGKKGDIIFCHHLIDLQDCLCLGMPVVCLGERWNGKDCFKNLHVPANVLHISNNIDELRWIIKNLLDK